MNLLFQLAVFAFIGFSFLLLISVPVVFAYPGGWTETKLKTPLFSGLGLWFLLVLIIGILNSFVV
uniref:Photosystem II reaction center protein Z n=1 Tax=Caulerpa lentillifera TaxID=148947 RepID=A0A345HGS7_9CHLO|nr:photosystem II reaction center protein Z [Caulerpa lentillifera]AXG75817.1 photosystem II reaction center protein Z [Caulerpa lentillifera]QKS32323.1 photosystem II reaction center protein Z [Caulerpa lentillifera]QUV75650.1 photosystem II subunit Z [Caulerpa lentillifera]